MRGLTRNLVILLVLVGLFSYLILPGLIEDQIARRLQTAFGSPTKPVVEVSSNFPPAMLLGHIDQVKVTMDQASLQGAVLYNAKADLKGVVVSVPQLLQGDLAVQTELLVERPVASGFHRPEPGVPELPRPGSGLLITALQHFSRSALQPSKS